MGSAERRLKEALAMKAAAEEEAQKAVSEKGLATTSDEKTNANEFVEMAEVTSAIAARRIQKSEAEIAEFKKESADSFQQQKRYMKDELAKKEKIEKAEA